MYIYVYVLYLTLIQKLLNKNVNLLSIHFYSIFKIKNINIIDIINFIYS